MKRRVSMRSSYITKTSRATCRIIWAPIGIQLAAQSEGEHAALLASGSQIRQVGSLRCTRAAPTASTSAAGGRPSMSRQARFGMGLTPRLSDKPKQSEMLAAAGCVPQTHEKDKGEEEKGKKGKHTMSNDGLHSRSDDVSDTPGIKDVRSGASRSRLDVTSDDLRSGSTQVVTGDLWTRPACAKTQLARP